MIYLLFDASAVVPFYLPLPKDDRQLTAFLTTKKAAQEAFFYIPVFCIAEVLNTITKHCLRLKNTTVEEYEKAKKAFTEHVRDRKFFYCYYMNRYHNYNCDEIFPIEHTINTEYTVTGLDPQIAAASDVNVVLQKKNSLDHVGKYYLSGLDILIISMGKELHRIHRKDFALITHDDRLANTVQSLKESFMVFNFSPKAKQRSTLADVADFFDKRFKRKKYDTDKLLRHIKELEENN